MPSAERAAGAIGCRVGRVLGVGVATVDIVNRVASFPPEDAEVRALDQRIARGGNCANTLAVLADLGRPTAFVGTLAGDAGAAFIAADLGRRGVDLRHARRYAGAATPTSYITLSAATGSRTIVHHRDLPELKAADFDAVDLTDCAWVHFEGRHPAATARMIARVCRERPAAGISVEIEKARPGIEALLRFPDSNPGPTGARVLLFSRNYAAAIGASAPEAFLSAMAAQSNARWLLAAWGADGAYGLGPDRRPVHAPAHRPGQVVDTLAAGDVFNAAIIDGLLAGRADDPRTGLHDLLRRANRLAGHHCGRQGLVGLVASARAAGLLPGAAA